MSNKTNHQPIAKTLRLIFAGTPEFAAHHLEALIHSPHEVVAVYTQPDRPSGRGKQLKYSPVKRLALAEKLPVFQPVSLKNDQVQQQLVEHQADVMVVVAYGLLLPAAVLRIPRYGCFNVHGSLLPRWRGAAPIQRTIAAGDKISGVTIMQMDAGLDTGDILSVRECPIAMNETSASLHDQLMRLGASELLHTLHLLQQSELTSVRQDNAQATYAEKVSKEEALIDWSLPAVDIERNIRAYNPFPVAYSFLQNKRVKIYRGELLPSPSAKNADRPAGEILSLGEAGLVVNCGRGQLNLQQLQIPGKKPMGISDTINGYSQLFAPGQRFASQ